MVIFGCKDTSNEIHIVSIEWPNIFQETIAAHGKPSCQENRICYAAKFLKESESERMSNMISPQVLDRVAAGSLGSDAYRSRRPWIPADKSFFQFVGLYTMKTDSECVHFQQITIGNTNENPKFFETLKRIDVIQIKTFGQLVALDFETLNIDQSQTARKSKMYSEFPNKWKIDEFFSISGRFCKTRGKLYKLVGTTIEFWFKENVYSDVSVKQLRNRRGSLRSDDHGLEKFNN